MFEETKDMFINQNSGNYTPDVAHDIVIPRTYLKMGHQLSDIDGM